MYITSWLKGNYTSDYLSEIMFFSNGLRLHDIERNNKSFQRPQENLYLKYMYGFRDGDIRFEIRVGWGEGEGEDPVDDERVELGR